MNVPIAFGYVIKRKIALGFNCGSRLERWKFRNVLECLVFFGLFLFRERLAHLLLIEISFREGSGR